MIYARTRRLSTIAESGSGDPDRIRSTLTEIGSMQGELHDLGTALLESMQSDQERPESGSPMIDPIGGEDK